MSAMTPIRTGRHLFVKAAFCSPTGVSEGETRRMRRPILNIPTAIRIRYLVNVNNLLEKCDADHIQRRFAGKM